MSGSISRSQAITIGSLGILIILLAVYLLNSLGNYSTIANIPVPSGLTVVSQTEEDLGPRIRWQLHLEGDVELLKAMDFYERRLPDWDWQTLTREQDSIQAERTGGKAHFSFHQEKHRLLVVINTSQKK